MNVAQERYFYELIDLTDSEIKILKEFINISHESVQGWQSDFLLKFTLHTSLKKAFEKNKSDEIYEKLRENRNKFYGRFSYGNGELRRKINSMPFS